ncbi:MAG TPA: CvpA family protein [Dehalococcoidia bacterium]|nr:CvpA family protein [Dehalococcoidia bacterium]
MNWLDIVLISVIAIGTLTGLWLGLIKAVLFLAGIIVGVVLAGRFHTLLSQQLAFIPQEAIAKIVAFAIILIGVMVIALVLARFLKWAASLMMLGWVNRLAGAAFGLLLASTFCGALLAAWLHFFEEGVAIQESMVANILISYFPLVLGLLPEEFDTVRSFFQ